MAEGAPGRRPAFFCEAVSPLDGGRLPSGAGLGVVGRPASWNPPDRVVGHRYIYYTT